MWYHKSVKIKIEENKISHNKCGKNKKILIIWLACTFPQAPLGGGAILINQKGFVSGLVWKRMDLH